MCRLIVATLLVAFCLPCAAQDVKQLKPAVGDRFTVVSDFTGATEAVHLGELAKVFLAKDVEGRDKMIEDKQAVTVKPGQSLTVLEVTTNKAISPAQYVECRLIDNGKAIGKVYVFSAFISDKNVKLESAKP